MIDIRALKSDCDIAADQADALERIFSINLDLFGIADTDGTLLRVNAMWLDTFGSSTQGTGDKFLHFVHPDDIHQTRNDMQRLSHEDTIDFINRYRCADNSYRTIQWRSCSYSDKVCISGRDITERKPADMETKRMREFLDEAQSIAHIGSWERDYVTNTYFWSDECYRIFGVEKGIFVPSNTAVMALRHPEDRERAAIANEEALNGKEYIEYDYRIFKPPGEIRYVHATRKTDYDAKGRALRGMGTLQDVTERKLAEIEGRRVREFLDEAQNIAHIGSWERDYLTDTYFWSDECYRIFGVEKGAIILTAEAIMALRHPDDREKAVNAIAESLNGKEYLEHEYRIVRPNGDIRYIHATRKTHYDESGRAVRGLGTLQDVTERKFVEMEMRMAKENLEDAQSIAHVGSWVRDYRTDTYFWSDECYRISGVDKSTYTITSQSLEAMRHPDDRQKLREIIEDSLSGKAFLEYDYRIVRPDGEIRYIHTTRKTLYDEAGSPLYGIGTNQDITERKIAELQTERIREFFEEAQASAHIGSWERDFRTDGFYWSDEAYRIYGVDKHSFIPTSEAVMQMRHPEDRKKAKLAIEQSFDGKEYLEHEYRIIRPDGEIRYIRATRKTYYDESGVAVRGIGTTQDITERVLLEKEIFNERELFRTTLLSVGDGVISTDSMGNIVIINQMAQALCGVKRQDAIAKPLGEVFQTVHEISRQPVENPVYHVLETGEISKGESNSILLSKSGKEIAIENSAAPIRDSEGHTTGVVIVFRDITEKREKQKQVEYLSMHDHLTGLYNRAYMEDAFKRLDTKRNQPFSIMVLDVNGLKLTNDAFGHQMGDMLLKTVAGILTSTCRADDIICRTGGDEFAILLPKTDADEAEAIKARIIEATEGTKLDSVMVSLAIGFSTKDFKDKDVVGLYKDADNNMYRDKMKHGKIMRSRTIETVLRNINNKYDQEQIHTERVSQFCVSIAKAMNLGSKEIDEIKIAGILHDIGKIIVPAEVLNKPEKLNAEEGELIRRHPFIGYEMLKGVEEYAAFAESVLYHHERWDGKGYPEGLKQEEIPFQARIIAVADAYEAMTAKRPYQKAKSKDEARVELIRQSGSQFDPEIVRIFVEKVL